MEQKITFENFMAEYMKSQKPLVQDPNLNKKENSFLKKYKKEDIIKWLENPTNYEKQLRNASLYLKNASGQYKRLCLYFAQMPLFPYVILPYKLDTENVQIDKFKKCYKSAVDYVDTMNIKHEFIKIMETIMFEDVFYGYEYYTKDSYYIKKLPPDFCTITSVEDGCYNYSFNFSYFDSRKEKLEAWGDEFVSKYDIYKKYAKKKWQELDSKNSICIKLTEGETPIPFFIGVLSQLLELDDYKALKKTKTEADNYKLLGLKVPIDDNGNYKMEYDDCLKYYNMLVGVLPEFVGAFMTPMDVGEYKFDKSNASSTDDVSSAEEAFWSTTGVSQLLFSSSKSGSSVINNSIRVDEAIVFPVLRQFERWVNRKLKNLSGTYKMKCEILNVTVLNRDSEIDKLEKAGTYGFPIISKLSAILQDNENDLNGLLFLENDVMKYHNNMIPLSSTHTQSGDGTVGKPKEDDSELDDAGDKTREQDETREKLVQ